MNEVTIPHTHFLETLFAYQCKVGQVFKDVLGLCEINHIAISHIDSNHKFLTFSSTPSLEFNLFHSNLWRFDRTYQINWYSLCALSPWQSLYTPKHFDALYYLKQIKHQYPLGLSFAIKQKTSHLVYSMASHNDDLYTHERFTNHVEDFYKIGTYCSNALLPLFGQCQSDN